jgi:transcriptional regulator CtsR
MEIRLKEENEQESIYLTQLLDNVKNSFSHSRVMAYVRSLMGDADVISSREICLANNEDFILLILAALKSAEKNAFYRVEFLNSTIDCNGYKIPEMRFINRKGK